MIENANRQAKQTKIEEIKEKLSNAKSLVLVKYQGVTVEQDTDLRKKLREADVQYNVYKNTLVKRALKEQNIEGLDEFLEGPTSIAFGNDETTAARIISDFLKENKKMELKAGYVDGEVYDEAKIKVLATIPSKEVLVAKFLGSIKSPLSNLAYLLNAIAEKKGEGSAPEAEVAAPAAE